MEKMLFTDFSAGFPGSFHDALAQRNSVIFQHAENQEILTDPIGQYKTRTADYGLQTTDYGLGLKHGLGIKRRVSIMDWG